MKRFQKIVWNLSAPIRFILALPAIVGLLLMFRYSHWFGN